jgi:cellulose synthase/poly-beta-1,6-N-acetylglucosamine synthase-like glycosyltransferase
MTPMSRDPLVSVIVPTLNRPAELPDSLASIAAQQDVEPGEVEVIVVNDGGTPAGHAAAAARERGLPVTVVDHPARSRPSSTPGTTRTRKRTCRS